MRTFPGDAIAKMTDLKVGMEKQMKQLKKHLNHLAGKDEKGKEYKVPADLRPPKDMMACKKNWQRRRFGSINIVWLYKIKKITNGWLWALQK